MRFIPALILLACCLFSSCVKDFSIAEQGSQIVLNGIFNMQENLAVTVHKSFYTGENDGIQDLEEAIVAVYGNGEFMEHLSYKKLPNQTNGSFSASFIPQDQINYTIIVDDPNLGQAEASCSIPLAATITTHSATNLPWSPEDYPGGQAIDFSSNLQFRFNLTIQDPPERNYYYLKLHLPVYELNNGGDICGLNFVKFNSDQLPGAKPYLDQGYIFTDEIFDNANFTISGTAQASKFTGPRLTKTDKPNPNYSQLLVDTSQAIIHLELLSEETYNFYSSHAVYIESLGDEFVEPSLIYSNVQGGLGFVGGVCLARKMVEIQY